MTYLNKNMISRYHSYLQRLFNDIAPKRRGRCLPVSTDSSLLVMYDAAHANFKQG